MSSPLSEPGHSDDDLFSDDGSGLGHSSLSSQDDGWSPPPSSSAISRPLASSSPYLDTNEDADGSSRILESGQSSPSRRVISERPRVPIEADRRSSSDTEDVPLARIQGESSRRSALPFGERPLYTASEQPFPGEAALSRRTRNGSRNDAAADQHQPNAEFASRRGTEQASGHAGPVTRPRRNTVVEIDDSSSDDEAIVVTHAGPSRQARAVALDEVVEVDDDDDIVFTGQRQNPNPPRPVPVEQPAPGGPGRQPDDFRRAMNEIDDIIAQRREAHDAIIAGQDDERRRQILSPPAVHTPSPQPAPRPRIGLGGGGLYRGGERQRGDRPWGMQPLPGPDAMGRHAAPGLFLRPWPDPAGERGDLARESLYRRLAGGDMFNVMNPNVGARLRAIAMGLGDILGPAGGPGPGREDVPQILAKVEMPSFDPPPKGYTREFDMDQAVGGSDLITIDDEGNVIENEHRRKPYIACASCDSPLLVASAYRSPNDRVYTLRCGHMIHQQCLDIAQIPQTPRQLASVDRHPDILGDPDSPEVAGGGRKRRNKRRRVRKVEEKKPDEYSWHCPIAGCGREHTSVHVDGVWTGKEHQGAVAIYA
ncbi:hypothetical protein IAU60_006485 [Kwoniella sp. DSM 27419]